jgi:hypothetical protein
VTSELIALAVLRVWSDHGTLTGAFAEAKRLSLTMFGRVAVNQ